MFEGLQKRWKVSSSRLLLILFTFAVGGSLTGYFGRKLMRFTGIENTALYIGAYIIVITILWPLMVLIVSIPMGQFAFFKKYIGRIGKRMGISNAGISKKERQMRNNEMKEEKMDIRSATKNNKPQTPNRIVIFASGAGSNAQKIIDYFRNSTTVNIAMIVCNKPGAGVIGIAEKEAIPLLMIEKERFFRGDGYVPELQKVQCQLIVLAGFLWKIPASLIEAYPRRIINIHPALLPKYGGKGMYGQYVHEAVLNAGEMQSGITIHYVDEHYDNGDVIFQTACPVLEGDSPEDLAHRIHELEHAYYPGVIEEIVEREYRTKE